MLQFSHIDISSLLWTLKSFVYKSDMSADDFQKGTLVGIMADLRKQKKDKLNNSLNVYWG